MKISRRGLAGVAAGAMAATQMDNAKINDSPTPPKMNYPSTAQYDQASTIQKDHDWESVQKAKDKIDKAFNGDFSEVDDDFLRGRISRDSNNIQRLKSISDAGREMIYMQREIERNRKNFLGSAKWEYDRLIKILLKKPLDFLK